MKKIKFSLLLGFLTLSFACFSQIHVNSTGELTLNSNSWPGGLKIGPMNYSGFTISSLYPSAANFGGLGTANNYFHAAYVHHLYGAIYDSWPSDKRVKENIREIGDALGAVKLLNPVKYDIRSSFYANLTLDAKNEAMKTSGNRLGFIAQEVQEIFPEIVHAEPTTGMLGISTMDLIPVLVQAIKEQQSQIEELKTRLEKLETTRK